MTNVKCFIRDCIYNENNECIYENQDKISEITVDETGCTNFKDEI